MVELTSRNDHINQIWTRMYLTLHQTFITVLLFFSSKQTWLRIQIMRVSFLSQHLLFYFIAPQCTIKAGHSAVWVDNNRLINFQKPTDSETENVFPLLSQRMQNKTNIYKSGPQTSAFDSYYLKYPVPHFWGCKDIQYSSTALHTHTHIYIYVHLKNQVGLPAKVLKYLEESWRIRSAIYCPERLQMERALQRDLSLVLCTGETFSCTGSWFDSWLECIYLELKIHLIDFWAIVGICPSIFWLFFWTNHAKHLDHLFWSLVWHTQCMMWLLIFFIKMSV